MRHSFMLIVSLCVAVGTAQAQQDMRAQEQSAADLAAAYQAWQQPRDTEEKISLGERVLALEPDVEAWSLPIPRQRLKAELSAGLGALYVARARGVPADNLEKAIEFLQAAVTTWTREADPRTGQRHTMHLASPTGSAFAANVPTTRRPRSPILRPRRLSSHARLCRNSGRNCKTTSPSSTGAAFGAIARRTWKRRSRVSRRR